MEQGTKPNEWDFISFLLSEADEETKIWKSLVEEELLMNEKSGGGGDPGDPALAPAPIQVFGSSRIIYRQLFLEPYSTLIQTW